MLGYLRPVEERKVEVRCRVRLWVDSERGASNREIVSGIN